MGFVYVDALEPEVPLVVFESWAETREVKKPKEDRALKRNMVLFELRKETMEVDMKSLFIPTYLCRSTIGLVPAGLESLGWIIGATGRWHCCTAS